MSKVATKPSKGTPAPSRGKSPSADYPALGKHRDYSTDNGSNQVMELTVGQYLEKIGVYDGGIIRENWENIGADFQRGILPINTNHIKKEMLHDLLRGGTLPPLIIYEEEEIWKIMDGLQRSSVLVEALKAIIAHNSGETQQPYAQKEIDKIIESGQDILIKDDLLNGPIIIQVWTDLTATERKRLFLLLNHSQQRIDNRHIIEVAKSELLEIFVDWGISVSTEKSEKYNPRHPGKKTQANKIADKKPFKFEVLIGGLRAYNKRKHNITTSNTLHPKKGKTAPIDDKDAESTQNQYCETDFKWVCIELCNAIRKAYGANTGRDILLNDTFLIPVMAALGFTRNDTTTMSLVGSRQADLIDLLANSTSEDPLVLEDPKRGLNKIGLDSTTNIGAQKRGMIFHAWVKYFENGAARDSEYPIDWQRGRTLSEAATD